ncbi:endonuclease/exonuclease/phosphatase family protein [Streptomyces sp. HB2AG]|uniref:endonuclease/exonuclease/phosphatase family protein n=1 Tax=Streptomyces sp. HB2AG TaxID=2983400 RepID=UPI0022A9F817|nr:endonuclease/exonuclease/phosphatase family protein [Streptomyces sp. HB2AG]MCZ2528164.1 endonuclease/exonuclease/phosphatase family protein [Streptomyces sp. HB2AG]
MAQASTTEAATDGHASGLPSPGPSGRPRWRDGRTWRRGRVVAALALLVSLVMAFHSGIPNDIGNLGSLTETFLPWLGLAVPILLLAALLRRSATALVALVLPAYAWVHLFGGLTLDKAEARGSGDLTVLTHNVDAANTDYDRTVREVIASGADVVALQELTEAAVPEYGNGLAASYPYRAVEGTVGLWSKYPLDDTDEVDIGLGWTRALRSTAATPEGPVAFYVAHLPSVRVKVDAGFTADRRDRSAELLGEAIVDDPVGQVVLLGDLNGTMNDRSLAPVTSQMRSAQGAAGDGFGFSWPSSFPVTRIDQIMTKGIDPVSSWVLEDSGSDHLPLAAELRFRQ